MNVDRLMKTPPGRLVVKMGDDQAFNWAVIIAWNFLQSLFPIALVMAAVLGVGLGYIGVSSQQVYGTVASIVPDPSAQKEVLATLNTFQQRSGIFFLVGFVGLVWSGAGLFRTMEQGFAVIYHTRQRALVKGVLMSVGMIFLLTVFGGLMLVTTTLLGLLSQLPYLPTVLPTRRSTSCSRWCSASAPASCSSWPSTTWCRTAARTGGRCGSEPPSLAFSSKVCRSSFPST